MLQLIQGNFISLKFKCSTLLGLVWHSLPPIISFLKNWFWINRLSQIEEKKFLLFIHDAILDATKAFMNEVIIFNRAEKFLFIQCHPNRSAKERINFVYCHSNILCLFNKVAYHESSKNIKINLNKWNGAHYYNMHGKIFWRDRKKQFYRLS